MMSYPNHISSYLSYDVDNIIFRFVAKKQNIDIIYPFTYSNKDNIYNSPLIMSPRTVSTHFVPLPLFSNISLDENNLPYINVM